MQIRKFCRIFNYAKNNSVFYHNLYKEAGVFDLDIRTVEDICKIPVITKTQLREAGLENILTSHDFTKINIHTTSGSTGIPLKFGFNQFEDFTAHVRILYILLKAGHKITNTIYLVTRFEKDDEFNVEKEVTLIKKIQKLFGLFKRKIISIYTDPKIVTDILLKEKPKVLWSTPSIMQLITNELIRRGEKLEIPLLFYTSETVFEDQESLFKKYLGKKIVNVYGAMESPSLGFDINMTGTMRTFPNSNIFEFYNHFKEKGKLFAQPIITNLVNYTTPIIRFDLGDLIEINYNKKKCIGHVYGRVDDIIELGDGRHLAHHHAHELFMNFMECEQWKIVKRGDRIKLQIKIKNELNENIMIEKASKIWSKRYPDVPLDVEIVNEFKIDKKTGKFKNIEIE